MWFTTYAMAEPEMYHLVRDYPKAGINFKDISKLLSNPALIQESVDWFVKKYEKVKITKIAGLESRGFLIGSYLAAAMKLPFVMIRKNTSLLPLEVVKSYADVEYRKDTGFQMQINAVNDKDYVLIVDDVLATGNSLIAAHNLITQVGGNIAGMACWLCIDECKGLEKVKKEINIDVEIFEHAKKPVVIKTRQLINIETNQSPHINVVVTYEPRETTIVLIHPDMKDWINPNLHKFNYIILDKFPHFPDGYPNMEFPKEAKNKNIIYIGTMYDYTKVIDQLNFLIAISRHAKTLKIYFPYYGPGTMERLERSEIIATADSMGYLISRCLSGYPEIHIFDLHVSTIRFGFDPQLVKFCDESAVHDAIDEFKMAFTTFALAFPDEGSYKRFRESINEYTDSKIPFILLAKKREGDVRKVTLMEIKNIEEAKLDKNIDVIIFDDIVNSGGTIDECRKALLNYGFKNISAYCTHAVMPEKNHYLNFTSRGKYSGLKAFFITNTNPQRSELLRDVPPFIVIDITRNILPRAFTNVSAIKVYSKNTDKVEPVAKYFKGIQNTGATKNNGFTNHSFKQINSYDSYSGVNPQPLSAIETATGARNRLNAEFQMKHRQQVTGTFSLISENGQYQSGDSLKIAIENGIIDGYDKALIVAEYQGAFYDIWTIPVKVNPEIMKLVPKDGSKTAGQIYSELYQVSASNWHKMEFGFNRSYIIYKALEILMSRINL